MANKKQGETVSKKSGAQKKSTAPLKAIDGGKATPKKGAAAPSAPASGAVLLRDGKTPANAEAMKKALGTYGVAFKPDASTEELLAALRKHLTKVLKPMKDDDKVKCDAVCGEVSTAETDFCPFCGDEGLSDEEPAPAAAPAEAAAEAEEEQADDEGAAEAAEEKAPAAPLAPASTAANLKAKTAKLEESVARINQLRTDLAGNSYDLGQELRKIHEEELWKARGHESFKEFIEKDLEISRSMAYRLIDVTKQFDRATFESVGSRKLALIAGIQDAEARDAALESAKAGASTSDVKRQVDDAKGKPAAPPKESGSKGAAPPPKKGNEITLLTKVGSKAQLVGFRSATSGRPIARHKDDAYAELQIADEVKLRMAPKVDKDGNLVGITVAFVRVGG